MILDGHKHGWKLVSHRRVPFSNAGNFEAFAMQRFVERGGVTARLVIEEFRSARLRLYPYLVWKTATYPDQPDNMELLEDFLGLKDLGEYMPPEYRDLEPDLYRD